MYEDRSPSATLVYISYARELNLRACQIVNQCYLSPLEIDEGPIDIEEAKAHWSELGLWGF